MIVQVYALLMLMRTASAMRLKSRVVTTAKRAITIRLQQMPLMIAFIPLGVSLAQVKQMAQVSLLPMTTMRMASAMQMKSSAVKMLAHATLTRLQLMQEIVSLLTVSVKHAPARRTGQERS